MYYTAPSTLQLANFDIVGADQDCAVLPVGSTVPCLYKYCNDVPVGSTVPCIFTVRALQQRKQDFILYEMLVDYAHV
jgi:hypothetical protein